MGEEVEKSDFTREDFRAFEKRLRFETDLLKSWFKAGRFVQGDPVAGCELEAWLIDSDCEPSARNEEFLSLCDDPMIVPELSQFNIEFNTEPEVIENSALSRMEKDLDGTWKRAQDVAGTMGLELAMIGILPTLEDHHLSLNNVSRMKRYKALNEQIIKLRKGLPIDINIVAGDSVRTTHTDVMLEAGTTSFQIHLQINADDGVKAFNASKIASAPLVAVSANSPFLFGKQLWHETRIPLFEQGLSVGKWDYMERVTFGIRYLEESLYEYFKANRQRYPVILPKVYDDPPERMCHLRLHNGTIWRWNRALIGFSGHDRPHLRLEQRVVPAGPTIIDCIANAAFYYGLVQYLLRREPELEYDIPFHVARDNFYEAARYGLLSNCEWKDEETGSMQRFLKDQFIPMAREGLGDLGLDQADIDRYMGIIEGRTESGQNGAIWQREYVKEHGADFARLCRAYLEGQNSGVPVHEWSL